MSVTAISTSSILVAEDDDDLRQILSRALRRDGHRVEEIRDGAGLLARLCEGPLPSLLITDLRMPRLDGLEALVRAGAERWVPTILVTAFPSEEVAERAAEVGAEVLAKPFDPEELRALARRVLRAVCFWAEPEHDGYGPIRRRRPARRDRPERPGA